MINKQAILSLSLLTLTAASLKANDVSAELQETTYIPTAAEVPAVKTSLTEEEQAECDKLNNEILSLAQNTNDQLKSIVRSHKTLLATQVPNLSEPLAAISVQVNPQILEEETTTSNTALSEYTIRLKEISETSTEEAQLEYATMHIEVSTLVQETLANLEAIVKTHRTLLVNQVPNPNQSLACISTQVDAQELEEL